MDSIIFDVDGTLWDSTESVAGAWSRYLQEKENLDISLTASQLKALFGQLLSDIAKQLFPQFEESEQLQISQMLLSGQSMKLCCIDRPDVYDGLEETLKDLGKRYPLFIVSNCQAGYIEVFLEATGLGHYFKGHLCPGDTGLAKAENIQKISRDYHLSDPVYVGDTMGDFHACQKAGVPFIFASYGFGEVKEPWKTIQKPADLLEICK